MKFYKMFRVELSRLLDVKNLFFTLILSFLLIVMSLVSYSKAHTFQFADVYQVLTTFLNGGYYIELLLLPIGYFVVIQLYKDVENKFAFFLTVRANKFAYSLTKYIVGFLYAFFMFELVYNVTLLIGMSVLPAFHAEYYSSGHEMYEDLLLKTPFLYFELRILYASLVMSFFVCFGMLITIVFQNEYVAALSPFLAYILGELLQFVSKIFPDHTYFPFIVKGAIRTSSSLGQSIAYILFFHGTCLIVVWIFYHILLKRRCYGK